MRRLKQTKADYKHRVEYHSESKSSLAPQTQFLKVATIDWRLNQKMPGDKSLGTRLPEELRFG